MEEPAVTAEAVFAALGAAVSPGGERAAAEAQIRAWETDAAPGFIGSLLKIASEAASVPEVGTRDRGAGLQNRRPPPPPPLRAAQNCIANTPR